MREEQGKDQSMAAKRGKKQTSDKRNRSGTAPGHFLPSPTATPGNRPSRASTIPSPTPTLDSRLDEWWDQVSEEVFTEPVTETDDSLAESREAAMGPLHGAQSTEQPPKDEPATLAERIDALRQEAANICGGELLWGKTDHFPLEIEEIFWRQLIAYESAELVEPFTLLLRAGVPLPPPPLLSELQLPDTLWELIYSLASIGCYLENTDHLSDRELYTSLWEDLLREPTILFPENHNFACHLDLIGSGSEEDQQIYLQYYACEETRRHWLETLPHHHLPPRRPRPWDRDRHLPRPYLRRADPLM
jgi:hypothetical protein